MNIRPPKQRAEILKESAEIIRRMEGIFERIQEILKGADDTVAKNIDMERNEISKRVVAMLARYGQNVEGMGEAARVVEEAIRDRELLQGVDEYLEMLADGFAAKSEGLLNYALGRETAKLGVGEKVVSMMLSASNVMRLKGNIRQLALINGDKEILIEMRIKGIKRDIFEESGLFIEDKIESEVMLSQKKPNSPRVVMRGSDDGQSFHTVIKITNQGELKTLIDGDFFDRLLALGVHERIRVFSS